MLKLMTLVGALLHAGAGDIYRCLGDAGVVEFSDQPCPGGDLLPAEAGHASDPLVLQRWLQSLGQSGRPAAGPSPSTRPAARQQLSIQLPPKPDGETALRACSSLIFVCAGSEASDMDLCVSAIPACQSNRSVSCCQPAYLDRYQRLRRAGADRSTAVREALLGF